MKSKIIFSVVLLQSFTIFSARLTKKYQEYWKARSQTASEQKVDAVLGSWIPGYNYVPGVASFIGEPIKEAALLSEGIWGAAQGESGSYGKVGNVLSREAAGRIITRIDTSIMSPTQNLVYSLASLGASSIISPIQTILRPIYYLRRISKNFNDEYNTTLKKGGTVMQAYLNAVSMAMLAWGISSFWNWMTGKSREFLNRVNSGYLQASYHIKDNDAYNQKIDTIFEENPILFTLAKDSDRKLLIAAKLTEMENPKAFADLMAQEQELIKAENKATSPSTK